VQKQVISSAMVSFFPVQVKLDAAAISPLHPSKRHLEVKQRLR